MEYQKLVNLLHNPSNQPSKLRTKKLDLSKQPALDADPRAIQQINFTVNLDGAENTNNFFQY